ncbi:DNA/RNA non-specific endonuclease [Arthrobacter sp. I2-34]|uniref:Serine protease n=1 Tax=Arthrobacter hankyongi TaxID=2904801 RepID=A0ABS9L4Z9_9MICC|nr:DNA/RNA non-specific endonuclease [Arthrobacter hankyongi]MCG2621729.1 DNA/RNA non-specific endonuclease [Arthrobacter hankyongi]
MIIPQYVLDATEARYRQHEQERAAVTAKIDAAKQPGGSILNVDDPERVAMRSRRILRDPAVRDAVSAAPESRPDESRTGAGGGAAVPDLLLERLIGGSNLLGVSFLETGNAVAQSVGRVHIRDRFAPRGFGTGFMVSPVLLLTNNHVLPDRETAGFSQLEFNFQNGSDGLARTPYLFSLEPQVLFLTDVDLDFSVVAVGSQALGGDGGRAPLARFGFNRAYQEQGKVLLGEFINIIQHPEGQPKQVALQQNELIDRLENFLHYRTDTAPGSSGSPLYNNQWEVVGIHHSGVPERNANGDILAVDGSVWTPDQGETRIKWVANEGVRISSILQWLGKASGGLEAGQRQLLGGLLNPPDERAPAVDATGQPPEFSGGQPPSRDQAQEIPPAAVPAAGAEADLAVVLPLHISVRLGPATVAPAAAPADTAGAVLPAAGQEAVSIDPDYRNRTGYDAGFLGAEVPLPTLTEGQRANAAQNRQVLPGQDPAVLPYHHFSLVADKTRRLALYTAVNIDGALSQSPRRDRDVWFFDPRLAREEQIGNELYASNDFDRGHLVRRLDPAWGTDEQSARAANDDTFHFTNSSPQHRLFNQGESLWAGLEDYLLDSAQADRKRLTVFTGPVFGTADPVYRGVQIPLAFWKIAVFDKAAGGQSATAYLVSQRKLVEQILTEAFVPETFQVPVRTISELTGLDFRHLFASDPPNDTFERAPGVQESLGTSVPGRELRSYADLQL